MVFLSLTKIFAPETSGLTSSPLFKALLSVVANIPNKKFYLLNLILTKQYTIIGFKSHSGDQINKNFE